MKNQREEDLFSIVFLTRDSGCPKPFALVRTQDHTGVSGTGTVAYGVQFEDGTVVIRWAGDRPSTVVWDSLQTAMDVHGHGGATKVVWLSENLADLADVERRMEKAEAALATAEKLLHEGCLLAEYGEEADGCDDTWPRWGNRTELFLRRDEVA